MDSADLVTFLELIDSAWHGDLLIHPAQKEETASIISILGGKTRETNQSRECQGSEKTQG